MTTGRRYRALLLGNWTFPQAAPVLHPLLGPPADLEVVRAALTDPVCGLHRPGDVKVVENATVLAMRVELERFMSSATRDEQILVYYSGHGRQTALGSDLYLCAYDTDLHAVRSTTVHAAEINDLLQESRAAAKVLVLDCCYSGNFRHKGDPAALPFTAGRGQAVLTSSQLGVTSLDAQTAGEPSPFTGHFAVALRGAARDHTGKGFLTSEDVYQYVHTQMAAEGPHRPARSQELVGDVALARARSGAVTADELDPDASATRTGAALELLDRNRAAAVQELRLLSESAHGDWRLFAALRLADLAASDGDTTTAIEAYGRVAAAGHRHWSPEADHQLGVQLSATGDAERAVIAWRRAADSGGAPWAARAAHRLGELLVGRSETTEAGLRYLRQAAAAEPAAAVDLGDTLRRCGEIDEARSVYRRVVAAGDPRWSATAGARLAGSAPP